jgi:hypothetical protein
VSYYNEAAKLSREALKYNPDDDSAQSNLKAALASIK